VSILSVAMTFTSAEENWTRESDVGETDAFRDHWPDVLPLLESLAPRDLTGASVLLTIRITSGTALNITPTQLALLTLAQCALRVDVV